MAGTPCYHSGHGAIKMKQIAFLLIAIAAIVVCHSQAQRGSPRSDLGGFSSDRLKACYDNKSLCGANDVYEISDELTERLPSFPTGQLVNCLADWKICGVENDIETGWAVSAEIARRGNPHELLVRYWKEQDDSVREGIIQVAYRFKTQEVTDFMRKVLVTRGGDDDSLYWPAD
jgi:hypothetical protein